MNMNKPDDTPNDERQLLIAIEVDGVNEFTSGWYDLHEEEYFTHDGEGIECVIGWEDKPTVEFI